MKPINPLESIVFVSLPKGKTLSSHDLNLDYSIPLPVQRNQSHNENFSVEDLTAEMIFAGILTVLAYDSDNANLPYYRNLILQARPNIKQELTEAAILKAHNEDYDIAEEIFDALRGLDPEDMATVLNTALFFDQRAESYRRSGLFDDADAYDESAMRYYRQAMECDSAPPDAFFNAGFFYMKQRNFGKGKGCFETYLALTDSFSTEELGENGEYKRERAREILENISKSNLDDEQFKAAFDLISNGQEEKGLEQIKAFLEKNPTVWNAWFLLGWGLRRLGRWQDAKLAFQKSVECGSTEPDTLNELAICHMELGEFKESRQCLVDALSLEPENTKVMSNLGCLELKLGNTLEAKKYFQIVLEFDPDDAIAQKMLEQIN